MRIISPDCKSKDHRKCYGLAMDEDRDEVTDCECDCHA